MEKTKIEIIGNKKYPTAAKVMINGREIHGVTAVRFEHTACEVPTLEIDLGGMDMSLYTQEINISETCEVEIVRG